MLYLVLIDGANVVVTLFEAFQRPYKDFRFA